MTRGPFFEDFTVGARLRHAAPRTIHGGDLSLYIGLYGDRRPLSSSTEFALSLGFQREVVHDLLVFHIVFGKTVADVSRNAVANLGYADVRFLRAVYPGDTLRAQSEVIGVREASSGTAGVVWVTTRAYNQKEQEVLRYVRWVLVAKRDARSPAPTPVVPSLRAAVPVGELPVPGELNLARFDDLAWATGGTARVEDYQVGARIHHAGGVTIEEADHGLATRLYQNVAHVHFDGVAMAASRFGKRLVYGGHVISLAHALSHDGLENALSMAAWNAGSHVHPTFAGDTIYAFSEVLERVDDVGRGLGALRLRLLAVKNVDPAVESIAVTTTAPDGGKSYHPNVVLDLDHWALVPRGRA
jgi:2-methylfumaryl-CoA hydratase